MFGISADCAYAHHAFTKELDRNFSPLIDRLAGAYETTASGTPAGPNIRRIETVVFVVDEMRPVRHPWMAEDFGVTPTQNYLKDTIDPMDVHRENRHTVVG